MKSFSSAIDRFCARHPRFGVPRLMLYIVIASAAVFLLLNTPEGRSFISFNPGLILRGQIWRLLTWVFIPLNSADGLSGIFFTAIALYFYYFIGSTLEREWGAGRFTIYYLFGMALHIVYGFIVYFAFNAIISINPMYLNLSMFFAFAVLFPDFTVRLFFIIPIKMKWLAIVNAGFFIIQIISGLIFPHVHVLVALMPLVALLNFLLICGHELLVLIQPIKKKASPNVINFKKEAKRVKREVSNMPYRHKCCVCGITDLDDPAMEFRYCSQCTGYHCFCSTHINNHIHFK